MGKIPYEKLDHVISTGRSGNGNNKRYAFNDFSDLKGVRGLFPSDNVEPAAPKRKKTHKPKLNHKFNPMSVACNQTHIFIPREESKEYPGFIQVGTKLYSIDRSVQFGEWIVLKRVIYPNDILGMYPHATELYYSIDGEMYPESKFVFANAK